MERARGGGQHREAVDMRRRRARGGGQCVEVHGTGGGGQHKERGLVSGGAV